MNIRNNEEYMDTTPYYAVKPLDPKVGDVYEYSGNKVLIVARQGAVCMMLRLMDCTYDGLDIRGVFKTNPYQMQYVFTSRLGDFQFRLRPDEISEVRREICKIFKDEDTALPEPIPVAEPYPIEEVHHPNHYKSDSGRECWDEMLLMFGKEALMWFCKLCIFKYRFRATKKGGEKDLKKAEEYMNKLEELTKGEKA